MSEYVSFKVDFKNYTTLLYEGLHNNIFNKNLYIPNIILKGLKSNKDLSKKYETYWKDVFENSTNALNSNDYMILHKTEDFYVEILKKFAREDYYTDFYGFSWNPIDNSDKQKNLEILNKSYIKKSTINLLSDLYLNIKY